MLVGMENDATSFASLPARRHDWNTDQRSSTLIGCRLPPSISEDKRGLVFLKNVGNRAAPTAGRCKRRGQPVAKTRQRLIGERFATS
jgi:hypothetical protein